MSGPSPPTELRLVTSLFVDVVGSTELATLLDVEDTGELMNELLAVFTATVESHGGRVFNYTGDGLLAVFGAEHAREDEAEWAVRAGLAIISETARVSPELGSRYGIDGVEVRVGLSTGQVSVGGSVERERGVRGHAVNMAARMQQAAPIGGLRISQETYTLVWRTFETSEEPPLTVKGIASPVQTHLVHRERPVERLADPVAIRGVDAPMVGRGAELALLQSGLLSLLDTPRLQATVVVAEAGVGKSRLLFEFDRWAVARPEPVTIIRVRAGMQTRQRPFGLLRDLVGARLDLADNEAPERARRAFLDLMVGDAPIDADGDAPAHLLGHLIGLDFADSDHVLALADDPEQLRTRGLAAARRMVDSLAANRPLLLVLEDVHWADDDTLDFLDDLAHRGVSSPVMIAASARPALDERRPGWLHAGAYRRLALEPLREADATMLADALLARVEPSRRGELHEVLDRAGGNPYYMEEILRMLLDSGAIEDDAAGRWLVHHDLLAAVHVPPTLAGVLQARLDALAAPHRVALQQASVIGFRFWDHALSAVDRQSVPALRPLAQRSLISAADATAIPGALEFTFKHHLLQQFTYDSVLKRDRRDYHARAARWLAALVEDGRRDLLGAAGDHFARAGEFAEAAEYFASAAEAARSRDARAAALDEATRGLALDDVAASVRWRLLVVREAVRALGGDPDGHLDDLDALEAVAEELDDDQRRAEAALRRGVALLDRGDHRDGEAAVRHAVELAARTANGRVEAVAVAELARAARRTNRNEEACDLATASLALARDLGDRRLEVQALAELAAAHGALGNIVDDLAISTEALELCPSTGDRVLEARLLNSMGVGLFATGAFDEARRSWRASVSLSQEIEWGYGEAIARLNLTGLAVSEGRYDEAVEVGVAARDAAASGGWRDLEAAASLHLGIGLHRRGDLADARATLEHSYALFLANDGPHYALDPLAALAVLDLDEGRADDALDKVAQVLDYVAAGGSLSSMEEPYRVRWDCYCVLGRLDDPRAPDVLGEARQAMTVTAATLPPEQRARWLRNDPYLRALLEAHPPFTPEAADDQRDRV